eukprot:TRINITY_DN9941_c0_g1_i2.p1 TRINITY_DN9941_c0_g1~~TRINITY_DN9941_c0_g1_i2.p1  ORF type:complete len:818 (+),score=214.51 TRINITY_DN9941_c0_g1_i2:71-2524(+)
MPDSLHGFDVEQTPSGQQQPRRQNPMQNRGVVIGVVIAGAVLFCLLVVPKAIDMMQRGGGKGETPAGVCMGHYGSRECTAKPLPEHTTAGFTWSDGDAPPAWDDKDNGAAAKSWATWRYQKAATEFSGKRLESPPDWRSSVVYNIQVDRFNNGDPSNDANNYKAWEKEARDKKDWSKLFNMRHGGDLKGIRDRLPYMVDLGINTIWATPVTKFDGQYHGYCTTDPTEIDPGFGTKEEFRDFVAEAHRQGVRVILDVVVNHLCDDSTTYSETRHPGDSKISACADKQQSIYMGYTGADGVPSTNDLQMKMHFSDTFFAPMRNEKFFNRCGPCAVEQMSSQEPITVFGDFTMGMFDYDTENHDFQELFTELFKYWIAFADVDGFRLDAAKHVTEDFLAYFSTEARDYAASLGKTNFFVVGEVAATHEWQVRRIGNMAHDGQNPTHYDSWLKEKVPEGLTQRINDLKDMYLKHEKFPHPGLNAGYNFYESGKMKDWMLGANGNVADSLGWYFSDENPEMTSVMAQNKPCCATSELGCTSELSDFWILLEIHDWPRFNTDHPKDQDFSIVGFAGIFTAPGQPVIYYGQEQGLNSVCPTQQDRNHAVGLTVDACKHLNDERSRQNMFMTGPWRLGSSVPALDDLSWIGTLSKEQLQKLEVQGEDPMLNKDNKIFKTVKALARLRRSCPALIHGTTMKRFSTGGTRGVLSFSRIQKGEGGMEILSILNPGEEEAQIDHVYLETSLNSDAQTYQSVFDDATGSVKKVEGHWQGQYRLEFEGGLKVQPKSFYVFARADRLQEKDPNLGPAGVRLCKPAAQAALTV